MARQRKRKSGQREPNGRLKRPSRSEREAAMRSIEDAEKRTVLAQPHRRGSTDQLLECAIGRFIVHNGLRRELYDAAMAYHTMMRKWGTGCWKAPRMERLGGSGGDIDESLARKWRDELEKISCVVDRTSYRIGFTPFMWALEVDLDIREQYREAVIGVLFEISVYLGFVPRDGRPFL